MYNILSITLRYLWCLKASNVIDMEMLGFYQASRAISGRFHFPYILISIIMDVKLFAVSVCFCVSLVCRCVPFLIASILIF